MSHNTVDHLPAAVTHGLETGALAPYLGPGLLALIGIQRQDDSSHARRLLDKLLAYRVFARHRLKLTARCTADRCQVSAGPNRS